MSLEACADLVRRGDPDRFRAAMASPVPARRVLFPLYAFNLEVARAPWVTEEPLIAQMRLQWWRDALAEIGEGRPVRRHEVTLPLAEAVEAADVPLLDALIVARHWEIGRAPFEDEAAFDAYLDATAGHLMWVAARRLGPAREEVVRDLAWAAGLAAFLRAVPQLEAAGRVPLPDGRPEAVKALARRGLDRLATARAARSAVSREAAPALLAGWQAGPVLRRAAADPARVGQGRLAPNPAAQSLGLLWRAAARGW